MSSAADKETDLRCIAFHEAGHAAAFAFTEVGWGDVLEASVVLAADHMGIVPGHGDLLTAHERPSGAYLAVAARIQILLCLAGPWADVRARGATCLSWRDLGAYGAFDHDLDKAMRTAGLDRFSPDGTWEVYAGTRGPEELLTAVDAWAREMLDITQVWQAVERCAAYLLDNKQAGRFELEDLLAPIIGLGRRLPEWQRRVYMTPGGEIPPEFRL